MVTKGHVGHDIQIFTEEQIQEHIDTCPISGDLRILANEVAKTNANVAEFLEVAKGIRFGIRILGWIERTAIWIFKVAGACTVIWMSWKFIIMETIKSLASKG